MSQLYLEGLIGGSRYYQLAEGVLNRLPEKWDWYRIYNFELSDWLPSVPGGYGSALREEELETETEMVHSEQCWTITLYEQSLSGLSDDAVKWVIAHELGHVAAGVPCASWGVGKIRLTKITADRLIMADETEMHEFIADTIARAWGFWDEEEAWNVAIQNA